MIKGRRDPYRLRRLRQVVQIAFLLEHLPSQMHLVIATREDPNLPRARLRARGQIADLRFTPAEAAEFFSEVMGLKLSAEQAHCGGRLISDAAPRLWYTRVYEELGGES